MHVLAVILWIVAIPCLFWWCCTHKWSNGRKWKK